jgi:GTP cyclohydrolase I
MPKTLTGLCWHGAGSKLARLVDLYAKRLHLQERLTVQVADAVRSRLEAAGTRALSGMRPHPAPVPIR